MEKKSSKLSFCVSALLFLSMVMGLAMPMQTARAAYATYDNPNYYYATIKNAPDGTIYSQAGLSPDGTKIVAMKKVGLTMVQGWREIVLMNADGSGETIISPETSGTGDINSFSNPFWSDDGTAVGFQESHTADPNKIIRYDIATSTRTYIYQPIAPLDATNADFLGSIKTAIVFWYWNSLSEEADLFTWDGTTLTNITNTVNYSEYEPVSNADGTKIVYWSGETTAEPVNTTHTLTYSGGAWAKDKGFTPIADSYWAYWTTPAATQIALTVMSTGDISIYDSAGASVTDLSGPGYLGGPGAKNFFGSMPQGHNGEYVITSNAGRADPASGRDIIIAAPRTNLYVDDTGSDSNPGTAAAPFATIQKAINEAVPGGTVNVAAGTYPGSVSIPKSLTLNGAQSVVNVSGRTAASASEATIQGLVTVAASNVNINGFTLTNPSQPNAVSITPSSSNVAITYNIIDNVGAAGLSNNVHAIVFQNGADSVTIAHNRFNNIKANEKTASAIGVLDSLSTSSSTGLLIQGNTFTDIASATKGAYGVIINNKAGAPGAQIKDNTFSGLRGGWTHAIGLETDVLNPAVTGNTFSNLTVNSGTDNAAVWFESNPSSTTAMVLSNKFNGTGFYGVLINAADVTLGRTATAEKNWWGNASGPGSVGPGTGALVSTNVVYSPWCADAACTTNGFTESLTLNGMKVTATYAGTGIPTVVLSNDIPLGVPTIPLFAGSGANYFDIKVNNITDPAGTLTVVLDAPTGQVLRYFADGAWSVVHSNDRSVPVALGDKLTVVFGPNSTPRLNELTGTPVVSTAPEVVKVEFAGTEVQQGESITAKVIAKSTNLYGAEVHLKFDQARLQVSGIVLGCVIGSELACGQPLYADSIGLNGVSNTSGTIDFAFTQTVGYSHTSSVSGDNILLATITFVGASSTGSATVGYSTSQPTIFSKIGGEMGRYPGSLIVIVQPATVTVQAETSVTGAVYLQGRSNHAGTTVTATRLMSGPVTTTASNGSFAMSAMTKGIYNFVASFPGYLTATRLDLTLAPGINSGLPPAVTLLGGDATRDGSVTIQDLAYIGARFLSVGTLLQADINGDGVVNILDLAMTGANYGKDETVW